MVKAGTIVLLLAGIACGGSSTAPTPTQANITVTVSPSPVTSTLCSPNPCQSIDGRLFQWRVQGTLTIQETAGIGGSISSITETSFNPPIDFGSDVIVQRSGTNRVPARGTLIFPLDVFYGLVSNPSASRQHVFVFAVHFTDDRGNQLTGTAQWSGS